MTKLTDSRCKNIKGNGKIQKLTDGEGLHLLITATGQKLWRMAYRFTGKQKTLSFGAYPTISLADARQKRLDAKALLADNIDPSLIKKIQEST
jgi:hypothetical protein